MKGFLENIWTKRAASLLGLLYAFFICALSYFAIFYKYEIKNRTGICVLFTLLSTVAVTLMIYSRHQLATKLSGFIMVPALLPVILLCFGSWEIIIPLAAAAVIIFFASGSNEGAKTILGTIFLLLYILASLAYFLFTTFLASPAVKKTVETGTSPSKKYRYEVIETTDSSNGCTSVILEPNDMDIEYSMIAFRIKGYDRTLCVKRPKTTIELEWKGEEMFIDGERWFTPSQAKNGKWFDRSNRKFTLS